MSDPQDLAPTPTLTPVTAGPRVPSDPGGQQIGNPSGAARRRTVGLQTLAAAVIALLIGIAVARALTGRFGITATVVFAVIAFVVLTWVIGRIVDGPRKAVDRLVTALVGVAFTLAIIPLVGIVAEIILRGYRRFDPAFFTETLRGVVGEGGGAAHAIVGTLVITAITAVISIPVGLLTAIYLVEYGRGVLARVITFLVDVMTGIPSIVAGLFAFALLLYLTDGFSVPKTGFAGSVALSVLMIPVVVRSCEEMLRLVPARLRESSYALGVPKWLTILKVVMPTAAAGIAGGITISIARVIGETAPLLLTAGFARNMNTNPFDGFMSSLPVYIYLQFTQPGVPPEPSRDRAWAAALVLVIIVLLLNAAARAIAAAFAPKAR